MLRRTFLKLATAAALAAGKIYRDEQVVEVEPGDPEDFSERIASWDETKTHRWLATCAYYPEAFPDENTRWVPED
jgi:hypothetical protein